MMTEQEREILDICHHINQQLQNNNIPITIQQLSSQQWYLQVLQILFPYLNNKIANIKQLPQDQDVLDALIHMLVQQQIIEDDFLDIKGANIVAGNLESIYYFVQLLNALTEREVGHQSAQHQQPHQQPNFYLLDSNHPEKERHSVLGINHEFQDSSEQSKPQQHLIHNAPITSSYQHHPLSPSNAHNSQQESSQQLTQKLIHNKSEHQLKIPTQNKPHRKYNQTDIKSKKLVIHPTIKPPNHKKLNPQSKNLTKNVIHNNKQIRNKFKTNQTIPINSPFKIEAKKKEKQIKLLQKNNKIQTNRKQKIHQQTSLNKQKSNYKLEKILKWRQRAIAKERKQFQQAIKNKLQLQRERYLKQINQFIIKMQKQRVYEQQKQFKNNIIKENQQAAKRMTGLEKWYQDRIKIIKQKKQKQKHQRNLIRTGHQQIIRDIERDLKKQNEDKMMKLVQRYREQQNQIQTDLEELTQKIIKTYKKY